MKKIATFVLSFVLLFNSFSPRSCFAANFDSSDKSASFKFTEMDEAFQFLSFEKSPRNFVESKYKNPVIALKALGAAVGGILGAVLGRSIENKTNKDVHLNIDKSTTASSEPAKEVKSKKSWRTALSKLFYVAFFAVLGGGCLYNLASLASLSFLNGKVSNLECEKNAKTLAVKSLLRQIKDSSWKSFDSLLIKLHLSPDNFDGNAAFQNIGVNYTAEEQSNFESSFDKLQQNLTQLIK